MLTRYQTKTVKPAPPPPPPGSDYFPADSYRFLGTGCTLLDCSLGGGWVLGRMANIVGDKSVGKTLLAIEAAANFDREYPTGRIWYREAEAAFDVGYATKLGLPADKVDFGPDGVDSQWDTIEDIFEDLLKIIERDEKALEKLEAARVARLKTIKDAQLKAKLKAANLADQMPPGLYIIDSLDALSSRAEQGRKIGQATYGADKPKAVSELFRRLTRRIKRLNIAVLIISQIRDRIGITFGERYSRTGGKAIDFYGSHSVWLSHIRTITRKVGGIERPVGVRVRAKVKKNKIGNPGRECEFVIRFGYGVDDLRANVEWLAEIKALKRIGIKGEDGIPAYLAAAEKMNVQEYAERANAVRDIVLSLWAQVEDSFAPHRRKYG